MSELGRDLLERHREMLDRSEQGEADDRFLDDVLALLDDLRLAGELAAAGAERARLRALIRFWSGTVFDYTGAYPTVMLLPADVGEAETTTGRHRGRAPPLLWLLAGGASIAVIAAALVLIGVLADAPDSGSPAYTTSEVGVRVRYVLAEEGLGGEALPALGSTVFCRGMSDLVFHFGLAGLQPDTELRWRLRREGTELAARPAAPYGEQDQILTVRLGPDDSGGFDAGQYDIALVSGGQTLWVETFEVTDVAPRAHGFRVSDVPEPAEVGEGLTEFLPGVRVLYMAFTHEGLCTGLELSHTLYRGGEAVQTVAQVWRGRPQGDGQAVFQVEDAAVYPPGDYEIATAVAGVEQGRVQFAIADQREP